MRTLLLLAFLLPSAPAGGAAPAEKRLTGLEKRVTRVEKRVGALEKAGAVPPGAQAPAAQAEPPKPRDPIAVYYVKKKQYVAGDKMGVSIFLEIENAGMRKLYAFDGVLVFRNEAGETIWTYPYGYSEPLSPGKREAVTINVSSLQARPYLKFIKAAAVTVALEKLAVYGE